MSRYIVRRLALLVLVVWGVATATFLLIRVAPGDPARQFLGKDAPEASLVVLRHSWGLDQPLVAQYFRFLWDLFRGNLGESLHFRMSNLSLIGERLPVTLMLMLFAAIFAIVISTPIAIWASSRSKGLVNGIVRVLMAITQGVPSFLVATILIIVFALTFRLFPVGGYGRTIAQHIASLVLPSITLALYMTPLLVSSLRESMQQALRSEYVNFARTKGLQNASVMGRYVIRNASISGISILGIQVGALAGGALVVENVFALPGMGSAMLTGILNRDFPLVQAATLVFGFLVAFVHLLTDLVYAGVDPRVKL